jgi:hypothetical protein
LQAKEAGFDFALPAPHPRMRSMRFIQWEMLMPVSRKPISEVVLEITDITSRPDMAEKQQADSYALKVKAAMTRLSESKR